MKLTVSSCCQIKFSSGLVLKFYKCAAQDMERSVIWKARHKKKPRLGGSTITGSGVSQKCVSIKEVRSGKIPAETMEGVQWGTLRYNPPLAKKNCFSGPKEPGVTPPRGGGGPVGPTTKMQIGNRLLFLSPWRATDGPWRGSFLIHPPTHPSNPPGSRGP